MRTPLTNAKRGLFRGTKYTNIVKSSSFRKHTNYKGYYGMNVTETLCIFIIRIVTLLLVCVIRFMNINLGFLISCYEQTNKKHECKTCVNNIMLFK